MIKKKKGQLYDPVEVKLLIRIKVTTAPVHTWTQRWAILWPKGCLDKRLSKLSANTIPLTALLFSTVDGPHCLAPLGHCSLCILSATETLLNIGATLATLRSGDHRICPDRSKSLCITLNPTWSLPEVSQASGHRHVFRRRSWGWVTGNSPSQTWQSPKTWCSCLFCKQLFGS